MEGGVTSEELEEAMKSRLSAVHTQVNDISGSIPNSVAGCSHSGGCGQSYEVVIVQILASGKVVTVGFSCVCEENDSCSSSDG